MKVRFIENVFSLTSECVTKRSHSFIIVTSPSAKTVKVQILKTHDNTLFVPLNFIVYLIFLLTRSCYFDLYTEFFFQKHINIILTSFHVLYKTRFAECIIQFIIIRYQARLSKTRVFHFYKYQFHCRKVELIFIPRDTRGHYN